MLLIKDVKRVRVIIHDLLEDPEARKLIEEILIKVAAAYVKSSV